MLSMSKRGVELLLKPSVNGDEGCSAKAETKGQERASSELMMRQVRRGRML